MISTFYSEERISNDKNAKTTDMKPARLRIRRGEKLLYKRSSPPEMKAEAKNRYRRKERVNGVEVTHQVEQIPGTAELRSRQAGDSHF